MSYRILPSTKNTKYKLVFVERFDDKLTKRRYTRCMNVQERQKAGGKVTHASSTYFWTPDIN